MGKLYQVRVEGIRFDAAHMETFRGKCEPLHGHSYQVAAEVEGELTKDAWVLDFVRLKRYLRELTRELDHRFVLQCDSGLLQITPLESSWKIITPQGRDYLFPREDVAALPVDNSSAERLCEWFGSRLWQSLTRRGAHNLAAVTLEVWEGPGQRASHRLERLPHA
jgi:6-pyruvoyl tetrahydropterin synthase/QueD family protein